MSLKMLIFQRNGKRCLRKVQNFKRMAKTTVNIFIFTIPYSEQLSNFYKHKCPG